MFNLTDCPITIVSRKYAPLTHNPPPPAFLAQILLRGLLRYIKA